MQTPPLLKLVLVTNMVAPYRVSFYNALAELVEFTVVVDTESEFNRKWKATPEAYRFKLRVMNSKSLILPRKRNDLDYEEKRQMHFSEKLLWTLKEIAPDVVVSNELGLRSFQSWLYCKASGAAWILASEATEHTEGWVKGFKAIFRRFLVTKADGFWANGAETKRFLVNRGAKSVSVMEKMTGIDSKGFRDAVIEAKMTKDERKQEIGLRGKVFVFAGRLDSGKGIKFLTQAIEQARQHLTNRASFLIIGDGEQKNLLVDLAGKGQGIPFHFTGFVQPHELPAWFSLGDVFLLPTLDDNWPLVNLEAVAGEMKQILSVFNGGAEDLAHLVGVGDSFDPRKVDVFAERLIQALDETTQLEEAVINQVLEEYSPKSQANRALISAREAIITRKARML